MANPKTRPLYQGAPAARRSAADARLGKAVRKAPGGPSSRNQIATARGNSRASRANSVRNQVNPTRRNVFNRNWMNNRIGRYPQRWHYWHGNYPASRWWRWATWASVTRWVSYNWNAPYYYNYDATVYLDDDVVYADDEPIAAYDDYVDSAKELAEVQDPPSDSELDWEPLGTWALSTDRDHDGSNMMLQFVLSKDGHLSGTYYNTTTDNTQRIKGSLDKDTQRLAFTIGDSDTTILEVGLDNLTKDQAPLWAHFTKTGTTQTWLLVRLESPEPDAE